MEILLLTSISDSVLLEFFISASSEDYLDLNNTYLYTRVKITKADGGNLAQGDEVGFINYPKCTMFSQHIPLPMCYRVSFELWKGCAAHTVCFA